MPKSLPQLKGQKQTVTFTVAVALLTCAAATILAATMLTIRHTDVPRPALVDVHATRRESPPAHATRHDAASEPREHDVPGATLKIEAAIDVDGDIKLWRRDVRIALKPEASDVWRDALARGCGGELYQRSGDVVHARLTGCDVPVMPPSVRSAVTTRRLARGSVGWLVGRDGAPTFGLALVDAALAEDAVLFGSLPADGRHTLDDLLGMTGADALDPPMHFAIEPL
jgi:hypothetical protein